MLIFVLILGLFVNGREFNQITLLLFVLAYIFTGLYYFILRMNVKKQKIVFYTITLVVLAIAFSALVNFENLSIDYSASINVSDNVTLNESYVYHVHAKIYHALYRNFRERLVVNSSLEVPDSSYVQLKGIEACSLGSKYAVDYLDKIYVWGNGEEGLKGEKRLKNLVRSMKRRNEAGIVSLNLIPPGDYRINYSFLLYPEVLSGKYELLKLVLAEEHVPYDNVKIRIHNDGRIVKLYSLFPGNVKKVRGVWLITGNAAKNERIEVDLLLNRSVNGYIVNVTNVKNVERFDYNYYKFFYETSGYVKTAGTVMLLLSLVYPAVPYAISRAYGERSEDELDVALTSAIPNRNRKPWEVNLLFKGDAFTFDEDGLKATLLDLERRGYLRVGAKEVEVLRTDGELDEFERELIKALKTKYGLKRVFTFAGDLSKLRESIVREALDITGYEIVKKLFYASLILSSALLLVYYLWRQFGAGTKLALAGLTILAISTICVMSPVQAFSRWSEEVREEREKWMKFIKKFSSSDFSSSNLKTNLKVLESESNGEGEQEDEELEMVYAVALGQSFECHPKFRLKYLAVVAFVASLELVRVVKGASGGGGAGGAGGW